MKNNHGSSSSSSSSRFHAEENNNHMSFSKPHRRSAPSSPVFSKGPRSNSASSSHNNTGASATGSPQSMQISMQPSSSNTLPTGAHNSYSYSSANNSASATSPGSASQGVQPLSGSTSSSSSMSEINLQLWQELQHHDLFKSPPVDRSVSDESYYLSFIISVESEEPPLMIYFQFSCLA